MLMIKIKREELQSAIESLISSNDAGEVFIGYKTETDDFKSRPLGEEKVKELCKKTIVITMKGEEIYC